MAKTKPTKKRRWNLLMPHTCKYCRQRFSWENKKRYISHLRHHEMWMLPHWFWYGKMKHNNSVTKPKKMRAKKAAPVPQSSSSRKLVVELVDIFGWRNKRKQSPQKLHSDSSPFQPIIGVDVTTMMKRYASGRSKKTKGVRVRALPLKSVPSNKLTKKNASVAGKTKNAIKRPRGRPKKLKVTERDNAEPVVKIEDKTSALYKLTNNRNHLTFDHLTLASALGASLTTPTLTQEMKPSIGVTPGPTSPAMASAIAAPAIPGAKSQQTECNIVNNVHESPIKSEVAAKKQLDLNNNPVKQEPNDSKEGVMPPPIRRRPRKKTMYPCQYCPKVFTRKLARTYHEAVHTGERAFKCQFCDQTFIQPATKTKHEMSHFGLTKTHKCRHCDEWFAGTHPRRVHEKKRHTGIMTYDCRVCDATFTSAEEKKVHEHAHRNERRYKCGFCVKAFKTMAHRKAHERIHTGEKPFECEFCKKRFIQMAMKQRCERKHTGERFKCRHCNKDFCRPEARNDHERVHQGDTTFMCNECGKIFDNGRSLKLHDMTHRGEKPFKCDYCDKRFTRKEHKKFHEKIHTGLGYFKCKFCPKEFRGKNDHKRHENSHTFETVYRCNFCAMGFSSSTGQRRHERTHIGIRKYKCEQCEKKFETPSHLRRHYKVHTNERPFPCGICKKTYRSAEAAKTHEQTVHLKMRNYKCNFCEQTFVNNAGRRYHEGAKHTGERMFQCKFCDKSFVWPNQKVFHERKYHTGEGMFDCTACDKKFVTKTYADMHFNNKHSKIKPYNCSFCKQGFGTQARLVNHERLHTGQFDFHCDICPDRFTNLGALNDHKRVYHPNGNDIKCKNCEKRFKTEKNKEGHERLHTKNDPLSCTTCGLKYCRQIDLTKHNQRHHNLVKMEKPDSDDQAKTDLAQDPLHAKMDDISPVLATIARFEETGALQGDAIVPVVIEQPSKIAPLAVSKRNLKEKSKSPVKKRQTKPRHAKDPEVKSTATKDGKVKPDATKDPVAKSIATKDGKVKPVAAKVPVVKSTTTKIGKVKPVAAKDPVVKSIATKDGKVKPVAAKDPVVKPTTTKDGKDKQVVAKDPEVKSTTTKDGKVKVVAAKDPEVKSTATKDGKVKPVAAKDPEVKSTATKDGKVKPVAAKDPEVKSTTTKDGRVKPIAAKAPDVKKDLKVKPVVKSVVTEDLGQEIHLLTHSQTKNGQETRSILDQIPDLPFAKKGSEELKQDKHPRDTSRKVPTPVTSSDNTPEPGTITTTFNGNQIHVGLLTSPTYIKKLQPFKDLEHAANETMSEPKKRKYVRKNDQKTNSEAKEKRKYVRRNVNLNDSEEIASPCDKTGAEPKKKRTYVRKINPQDKPIDSDSSKPPEENTTTSNETDSEPRQKRKYVRKNSQTTETDTAKPATETTAETTTVTEFKQKRKYVRKDSTLDSDVKKPSDESASPCRSQSEPKAKRKYVRRSNTSNGSEPVNNLRMEKESASKAPSDAKPASKVVEITSSKEKKSDEKKQEEDQPDTMSSSISKKRSRITLKIKLPLPPSSEEKTKSQTNRPVKTTSKANGNVEENPIPKERLNEKQICETNVDTFPKVVIKLEKNLSKQIEVFKENASNEATEEQTPTPTLANIVEKLKSKSKDNMTQDLTAGTKPQSNPAKGVDSIPSKPLENARRRRTSSETNSSCGQTSKKTRTRAANNIPIATTGVDSHKSSISPLPNAALDLTTNHALDLSTSRRAMDPSIKERSGLGMNYRGMIRALDFSMKRQAPKKTQGIPVDQLLLTPSVSHFPVLGQVPKARESTRPSPISPAIAESAAPQTTQYRVVDNTPRPGQVFANQQASSASHLW